MEMPKLTLSSSPHVSSKEDVSSVMRDVVIALLPAALAGAYYFRTGAIINMIVGVIGAVATEFIIQNACKLYNTIVEQKAWPALKARCCDFLTDERQCMIYCEEKGLIIKDEIKRVPPQAQECSTKQGRSNAFITQQMEPPVFEP